jgi:plasmid stabilization system protein ParE
MNQPVILSPVADRECEEAAAWYERVAGLGERFVGRVQEALDCIGEMPEFYAAIHRNIRRVRVRRFPYIVFDRLRNDRIEVIAVFHNTRNPKLWRSRAQLGTAAGPARGGEGVPWSYRKVPRRCRV